jgi:hypothetical protein
MGMIFNSTNTLAILEFLHDRYVVNFNTNRTHHKAIIDRDIASGAATYTTAHTLGIDLPAAGDSAKWQTWLNAIDAAPSAGSSVGMQLKQAMSTFLGDPNCIAIEFFVLPSPTISIKVTPTPIPNAEKYWGSILIETLTYDQALDYARAQRG